MIRYSHSVGKRVEVVYRLKTIQQVIVGLLFADSGESIFLEQHLDQSGPAKTFRLKIPYHCIVRLNEINPSLTRSLPPAGCLD
jgi:hypothetical protein